MQSPQPTDLVIVGAGAAGLMAAATAAEFELRTLLIERKHLPGRKLLMCGNNRCNLTRDIPPDQFLSELGEPVSEFARAALNALPPKKLRQWFADYGLRTTIKRNRKVYPASEKADDVLHCFQDQLRRNQTPLMLNAPVTAITAAGENWNVTTDACTIETRHVLIATGGVSYPKTGSVGDGQKLARTLGHHVEPYRPGLAGFELAEKWLRPLADEEIQDVKITIFTETGRLGTVAGDIIFTRWGARGGAFVNACRACSRNQVVPTNFEIDLLPDISEQEIKHALVRKRTRADEALRQWLPQPFLQQLLRHIPGSQKQRDENSQADLLVDQLKRWQVVPTGTRPLKEAMTTVGGVRLQEVEPATMQSRKTPGIWFAGEVMDVDGPTGGYNLQLAFSTAQLAVTSIADALGARRKPRTSPPGRSSTSRGSTNRPTRNRRRRPRSKQTR